MLGSTVPFTFRVESGADPNHLGFRSLSAVVLTAFRTLYQTRVSEYRLGRWSDFSAIGSAFNLRLYRIKHNRVDNGIVGILGEVARFLPGVLDGFLGDVVLTEGLLKQKVSR